MAEILTRPNLEDLSPKDKGQWLLAEAQKRLVAEKEREIVQWHQVSDSVPLGEPKAVVIKRLEEELERIHKSPNVVYRNRGRHGQEQIEGDIEGYEAVKVTDPFGSGYVFDRFARVAKRRCEIAAEIASEVGFEVLGKGIHPRPKWGERYTGSYDFPPRLEVAPENYQRRVADEMQDELAMKAAEVSDDDHGALEKLSEKFDAVSLSLGLSYDSRQEQEAQELKGILDGKLLEINVYYSSIGSGNRNYIGVWGEKNMEEQQTLDIWSTYITVVAERQQRASNIWENEKYILEQLGVA